MSQSYKQSFIFLLGFNSPRITAAKCSIFGIVMTIVLVFGWMDG